MKKNILISVLMMALCLSSQWTVAQGKKKKNAKPKAQPSLDYTLTNDLPSKYAKTITQEDLSKHLHIIAADSMEGRNTGERGQKKAAKYITEHFKSLELLPSVPTQEGKSYLQDFQMLTRKWNEVSLKANGKSYEFMKDMFVLFNSYEEDEITVPAVYAKSTEYAQLEALSIKGKAVLIQAEDWGLREINQANTTLREKGAAAVLIIPGSEQSDFDELLELNKRYLKQGTRGISSTEKKHEVIFFLSPNTAQGIFGENYTSSETGTTLGQTVSLLATMTESVNFISENVLGFLEGTDKKEEVLVITAHYDHIGMQGAEINNGADDDGSGTVAVLELAEAFAEAAKNGNRPRRSVLFMTVSGEEKGLLGSRYYTDIEPIFPLENTVANLNIDMIGRIGGNYREKNDPNYVYLIGSDKLSTELHQLSEEVNKKYINLQLDYKYNDENDPNRFYYRSDHYNFAKNNIPIIFYFNGVHEDYHQPTDTVDKIHFPKLEKISRLVFMTAWEIANRAERLKVDKAGK